ncbi:MAG: DUF167 domain-containing protein [Alphaproteobacteria bacterium]|nr:DUF167 domain-containing protein [Alphaproteobacteria bacterium]
MTQDSYADVIVSYQGGVRLTVRAKPGSTRMRTLKIVDIGDGKRALEVSVAAQAQEGKANRAIIERLADELGVGKKDITIRSGDTGRIKIVEVKGSDLAATLLKKLG